MKTSFPSLFRLFLCLALLSGAAAPRLFAADDHDCIYCQGAGTCTSCGGTGHRQCVVCAGTGKDSDGKRCTICRGRGKVDCVVCNGSGRCNKCFGSGWKDIGCIYCKGSGVCRSCFGTGKMPCVVCAGTGLNSSDHKSSCPICHGTGKVDCPVCKGGGDCDHCNGKNRRKEIGHRQHHSKT